MNIWKEGDPVDFVVCMKKRNDPGQFKDNMVGVCCMCAELVVFRPYNPSEPPRICVECAILNLAKPEGGKQ